MQHRPGVPVSCRDRDDSHHSIIADIRFLIAGVDASIGRIELAMGREAASESPDSSAAVVVLDDVTPRYLAASAALSACRVELDFAMHALQETGMPESGTEAP